MPQIRVLLGYQQGQVFSLAEQTMVIGRDPKSGIVLHPDSAASRRHAEVFPAGGYWRVRDLDSVNGTAVNGRRVKDEVLRDQDEMVIGDNVFVFEDKDADASQIAEAASHVNLVDSRGFQNRPEVQALVHAMAGRTKRIETEVGRVSGGQAETVRRLLTAIISQGHILLDGSPGFVETAIIQAVAEVLGMRPRRIELTPESKVSDLTGTDVLSQLLVVEAINRASLITQAVLFEGMQEYRVNVAGQIRPIEPPFVVLAAQKSAGTNGNPVLSEAQIDRFMFSIPAKAATGASNGAVAATASEPRSTSVEKVLTVKQVLELQRAARDLPVSDHVARYAVRLVRATRPTDKRAPDFIKQYVTAGAGARGAEGLILGAKARAILAGRLLVSTDDVRRVAGSVLRHRITTSFTGDVAGVAPDQLVERLVAEVSEPGESEE